MAEQPPPVRLLLAIVDADDDSAAHRILAETDGLAAVKTYLEHMLGR
jgi:hypothetical protein